MSAPESDQQDRSWTQELGDAVVRSLRDYAGRGCDRVRVSVKDGVLTVLLEGTLTKGERTLVADGREETVLEIRRAFQDSMRRELIDHVERFSGRSVLAMLSANHIDPDMAAEVFVLGPPITPGSSAASTASPAAGS